MKTQNQSWATDLGLFLIRAIVGAVFVYHGAQKLFGWFGGYGLEGTAGWMGSVGIPLPTLSAALAGGSEFFGGIVLLLGTGTRLAAIPMAFTMAVAVYVLREKGFNAQAGGFEYALQLGVVLIGLVLTGPGRLTVAKVVGLPRRQVNVTGSVIPVTA